MNCRPDELARIIFVPEWHQVADKMVHVIDRGAIIFQEHIPAWRCIALQPMLTACIYSSGLAVPEVIPAGAEVVIPDAYLRPIRPGEGDDETLQWAGKPQPAEVH